MKLTTSPPFRVWLLIDMDWLPVDCQTVDNARDVRLKASEIVGAEYTIVSVPGEPEYDGDLTEVNGHIVMGRM